MNAALKRIKRQPPKYKNMVLERYPDMMSLTDAEQDVASRLPTPQKEPRPPVDENLSPTALAAIQAAEQRRKPRRPPPPMPRTTPPGARPPTHRSMRAPVTSGASEEASELLDVYALS